MPYLGTWCPFPLGTAGTARLWGEHPPTGDVRTGTSEHRPLAFTPKVPRHRAIAQKVPRSLTKLQESCADTCLWDELGPRQHVCCAPRAPEDGALQPPGLCPFLLWFPSPPRQARGRGCTLLGCGCSCLHYCVWPRSDHSRASRHLAELWPPSSLCSHCAPWGGPAPGSHALRRGAGGGSEG